MRLSSDSNKLALKPPTTLAFHDGLVNSNAVYLSDQPMKSQG